MMFLLSAEGSGWRGLRLRACSVSRAWAQGGGLVEHLEHGTFHYRLPDSKPESHYLQYLLTFKSEP